MKYNFYSGLSGKTAIMFLLAFISVGLPVNWIVYNKVKSTLTESDTQQLRSEAEKLASSTKLDPVIVPLPAPGYSLNLSEFKEGSVEPIFVSPDFPQIEFEWFLEETIEIDTLKVFRSRIVQPDGSELWFTLARSNRTLNSQLAEIKAYLFYLTGGAFLLILVLVFLISGFMFRPLKRLVESSNRVQAAEKMPRLPVPLSHDETHELALALNEMINRIESTINNQVRFFESATHELKTPLSIMRAELSRAYSQTTDLNSRHWISNLQEETNRLERSIADFLLISQLKNQTITLSRQPVHLSELVFDVMQKLKPLAGEKSLTFSVQQDQESQPVNVDTDKIHTVILNLIENAIHYSLDGSSINIRLQASGTQLNITNPVQAPVDKITSLGESRYVDSQRGMGLGLWISKQLVDLHHGSLQFECVDHVFEAELKLS